MGLHSAKKAFKKNNLELAQPSLMTTAAWYRDLQNCSAEAADVGCSLE